MRTVRVLAGVGLTGVLIAAPAAAASASPSVAASPSSPTGSRACSSLALGAVKAHVNEAVANRLLTIQLLTNALGARPHVSSAHRSTLSNLFTSDTQGLTATNSEVQADTTCATAVSQGRTVVTSFRVYLLLVPQTRLTAAADTGSWAAGELAAAEPKLQAGVAAITDPSAKAEAEAALADLTSQVTQAAGDFSGVGDTVLAMTPPEIPGSESTLDQARTQVTSGREALAKALKDAATIAPLLVNATT
jgi:hypothetical protein